jgi:hypothetical protein
MDKLSIVLSEEKAAFAPREVVRGVIEWRLDSNPKHLDLSLFWYTSGKGTRDVGMIGTARFDSPGAYGSKEFSFPLPEGPYSFSGRLISLIWAIELTCSPGSETVRREFTLSPTGQEIVLGHVPAQARLPWSKDGSRPDALESVLGVRK